MPVWSWTGRSTVAASTAPFPTPDPTAALRTAEGRGARRRSSVPPARTQLSSAMKRPHVPWASFAWTRVARISLDASWWVAAGATATPTVPTQRTDASFPSGVVFGAPRVATTRTTALRVLPVKMARAWTVACRAPRARTAPTATAVSSPAPINGSVDGSAGPAAMISTVSSSVSHAAIRIATAPVTACRPEHRTFRTLPPAT